MAGLDAHTPTPSEIRLHQVSRVLEIAYSDGRRFSLPCEFLRVYSPSADVRGHGPGQETLQVGKRDVAITDLVCRNTQKVTANHTNELVIEAARVFTSIR